MTTRISRLPLDEWSDEQRVTLEKIIADDPEHPDPLAMAGILVRHYDLFQNWVPFAQLLHKQGLLADRDRELIIVRVAERCDCAWERFRHEQYARDAGLSDEEIASVQQGPTNKSLTSWQRTLVESVDDLCSFDQVSAPNWNALHETYDEARMIEFLFLVGAYRMLAGFLNSVALMPPPAVS